MNAQYPIDQYLSDAKIVPGALYHTNEILEAVKSQINGKSPALECHRMNEFNDAENSYPPTSRSCDPNSSKSPTSCNNEMDLNENEVMVVNKSLVCIAIVLSRCWINFMCCCFRVK